MASVSFRKVYKRYGSVPVIHGIDLEVAHNELMVLVGPSGCGKSTMLRMVAGLEDVSGGEIHIGDRLVNNVEPKNRDIAMVFQNYALYPHMSVFKNISFGLRAARLPKAEVEEKVRRAAGILGLSELLHRKPGQLSGGQRQRVAMGRAIVRDPQVFLFDEPLSNLDAKLRNQMRVEIKKLHRKVQTTIIFVTHDQVEAMTLSDRIVIMSEGRIQQVGTPIEVYARPVNTFVAEFIGSPTMNLLPGHVERVAGATRLRIADGFHVAVPPRAGAAFEEGQPVIMGIRPEDMMTIGDHSRLPEEWRIEARIVVVEPLGSESILSIEVAGLELTGKSEGRRPPEVGASLAFGLDLENLHIFNAETGRAIY